MNANTTRTKHSDKARHFAQAAVSLVNAGDYSAAAAAFEKAATASRRALASLGAPGTEANSKAQP